MSRISDYVLAVVNTKGGVGKSTFTTSVLPFLIEEPKEGSVKIYEIDANNEQRLANSKIVEYKSLDFENKSAEEAYGDISFDILAEEETVKAIDAGGGDDTKRVLKDIAKYLPMEKKVFFVPVGDDADTMKNVEDTLSLIQSENGKALVYLVYKMPLSKINNMEAIKERYSFLFGNKELGIEGLDLSKFQNLTLKYIVVPEAQIMITIKNSWGLTFFEAFEKVKGYDERAFNEDKKKLMNELVKKHGKTSKMKQEFQKGVKELFDKYNTFLEIKEIGNHLKNKISLLRKEIEK